MTRTATVRGYLYSVDNEEWYWDLSQKPSVNVRGWRVTRQKVNGKDGRAYPRTIASFFGPDAESMAETFFGEKTR